MVYSETKLTVISGYDLDGTICSETVWRIDGFMYKHFGMLWAFLRHIVAKPIMRPLENFIIITGRPASDRWYTELWLKMHRIRPKDLYMIPQYGSKITVANYKAKMIQDLNLKAYFENDVEIYTQLKILCPNVKIFLVHVKG